MSFQRPSNSRPNSSSMRARLTWSRTNLLYFSIDSTTWPSLLINLLSQFCHSERSRGISNSFFVFEILGDVSASLDMTNAVIRAQKLNRIIHPRQDRDAVLQRYRSGADYACFVPGVARFRYARSERAEGRFCCPTRYRQYPASLFFVTDTCSRTR